MRDGDKDLSIFVAIAIIITTLIVGNFATPSYGKKVQFETPFESSTIPACGDEEVIITGVANFAFEERTDKNGNLRSTAEMKYHSIQAIGVSSGTEYNIHEKEKVIIEQEGGDTTFNTAIKGSFISKGSDVNTLVKIRLVISIDENGIAETIVDDVDVKCAG